VWVGGWGWGGVVVGVWGGGRGGGRDRVGNDS